MPLPGSDGDAQTLAALPLQHNKVVLVMDLVESVRLMAAHEASVVHQWHRFLQHAQIEVLPRCGGRLVKSLGDGILAEFDDAVPAIRCAHELHRFFDETNANCAEDDRLMLRAGLNATHLYVDANDVYGHGVNLAARVAGLAGPGETVVTASVRDSLVDGVDAEIEDMGESYLKHWPEPVRTWVVRPPQADAPVWQLERRESQPTDFRPSIAVIPFEARNPSPEHFVVGEIIADGVIAQLSRSQDIRVISRLSTTAFRGRSSSPGDIDARLDATFALTGSYTTMGSRVLVMAELAHTRRNEVVWAERLGGDVQDLLEVQSELIASLSTACAHALLNEEVQRTLVLPLPRLDSNSLMLGGITLMHRSTPRDLQRSLQLLEAVAERHKRVAAPKAWLAKWHIMHVVQGLSSEPEKDFQLAIDTADRALDMEPNSSLALAIKGHAMCHLGSDVDASRHLLQEATQSNPNDPMAWLYSSVWSSMWGTPEDSVKEAENALLLSPLDPQKYYFEMMLAISHASRCDWEKAIKLCKESLLKNRHHMATIRCLLVSQYESGRRDEARLTLELLKRLQPQMTIAQYLASGGNSALRQRVANAMTHLGIPNH